MQDFCEACQFARAVCQQKVRNAGGGYAGEHRRRVRIDVKLLERLKTLLFQQCLNERKKKPDGYGSTHESLFARSKKYDTLTQTSKANPSDSGCSASLETFSCSDL